MHLTVVFLELISILVYVSAKEGANMLIDMPNMPGLMLPDLRSCVAS